MKRPAVFEPRISIVAVMVSVRPRLSVTVSASVYSPGSAYVCDADAGAGVAVTQFQLGSSTCRRPGRSRSRVTHAVGRCR